MEDSSSPSGGSNSSPTPAGSYKAALLTSLPPPVTAPNQAAPAAVQAAAPQIVLRSVIGSTSRPVPEDHGEGWQVVKKGRAHPGHASRRPRQPVPVDLQGRCFNCGEPGHHSYYCPRKVESGGHPKGLAWKPVVKTEKTVAVPVAKMEKQVAAHQPHEARGEPPRRRAWHRHRRPAHHDAGTPHSGSDVEPIAPEDTGNRAPSATLEVAVRPLCIIERLDSIAHAEADLHRALLVTVVGNCPAVSA